MLGDQILHFLEFFCYLLSHFENLKSSGPENFTVFYCSSRFSDFKSDLINSYAWDTAIVFIQNCTNTKYSRQNSLNIDELEITGTTDDIKCNIYDMASNEKEWTTEMSYKENKPCVYRGGMYNHSNFYTSSRISNIASLYSNNLGFRPILYL